MPPIPISTHLLLVVVPIIVIIVVLAFYLAGVRRER
jgi:hypothetical protein